MPQGLAATKQPTPAKPASTTRASPLAAPEPGEPAGLPQFLQPAGQPNLQRHAQSGSSPPGNGAGSGNGPPGERSTVHQIATTGLRGANSRLPHFARIQQSFGRHDIGGTRARVGGEATAANESLGSLAYTRGSSIAFKRAPDLKLAAHEAAHVVQQRRGVQLKSGVGRSDDAYERQADSVAEKVAAGESAQPLLDAGPSGGSSVAVQTACGGCGTCASCRAGKDDEPLQFQLQANATRVFEPEVEPSAPPERRRAEGAGEAEPEGEEEEAAPEEEGTGEEAEDPAAAAEAEVPPAPEPTGGGDATVATGGGRCSSGGVATCWTDESELPPEDQQSDDRPPNPEPAEVEEETSAGDEEEAPEPDDCPAEDPAAAPSGAAAAATPGGSSAAAGPAAEGEAAAAPATGAEGAAAPGEAGPDAAGAGGGDAGGAPEEMASVGSPLDGVIAAAEGGHNEAVAAYGASSMAMGGASEAVRGLRTPVSFAESPAEGIEAAAGRRDAAARASRFFSGVADQLDRAIATASQQVPDQLGLAAESAKMQIAASIETQKLAISARIAQARRLARSDAADAKTQVRQQADSFIADVRSQTTTAIESLTSVQVEAMGQVNDLETGSLDEVSRVYADGRTRLEGLGTTVGDECTATGEQFASTYATFRHCTENGFWDGDLSQRRSIAQEDAARETAQGYHDRMVDSARRRAREITRAGRKADRCKVIASANAARDTLTEQLAALATALETARDGAIQAAEAARDGLVASIDSQLAANLRTLDRQEREQRQTANDTGYLQQLLQEQTAHSTAAAVQQGVEQAVVATQSALAEVQAQFAGSSAPDPAALSEALAAVEGRIGAAISTLDAGIARGATGGETQLADALRQGLAALDGVTQGNAELTAGVSGGFTAAMSAIAGQDNFAGQRKNFTQVVEGATAAGGDALRQAVQGMQDGCDATLNESATTLDDAAADLETNLRQGKQGIECAITNAADKAASEEPPAWKMLVAILLIILVVVIIIAVTVVTAGGALAALGPIATIAVGAAIGAAVGAITSGLLAIAGNLMSNRTWHEGVGRAVLIGAVTGAIGGGLGAGVGLALRGASVAIQYGAQFVLAGGLNAATQFVLNGFTFENFSWGSFGLSMLITLVTLGIARGVQARQAPPPSPRLAGPSRVPIQGGNRAPVRIVGGKVSSRPAGSTTARGPGPARAMGGGSRGGPAPARAPLPEPSAPPAPTPPRPQPVPDLPPAPPPGLPTRVPMILPAPIAPPGPQPGTGPEPEPTPGPQPQPQPQPDEDEDEGGSGPFPIDWPALLPFNGITGTPIIFIGRNLRRWPNPRLGSAGEQYRVRERIIKPDPVTYPGGSAVWEAHHVQPMALDGQDIFPNVVPQRKANHQSEHSRLQDQPHLAGRVWRSPTGPVVLTRFLWGRFSVPGHPHGTPYYVRGIK